MLEGGLENMLGAIRNWDRWSEIVAVRVQGNESGKITFVNMLSSSVFEWLVILVGCKMNSKKKFGVRESKNLLPGLWTL